MTNKEFLNKVIELGNEELAMEAQARLEKMAASEATRKSKNKTKTAEENAPLLAALMEAMTIEPMTVAQLNEAAEMELSTQKINALLKSAIEAGTVVKGETKVDSKKRVTYALAE